MTLWNVYAFFHGGVDLERNVRLIGRVSARDAFSALDKARKLAQTTRTRRPIGGIDVRRGDLPSLTTVLANKVKARYGSFTIKPGRPTKAVSEARKAAAESSSEEASSEW